MGGIATEDALQKIRSQENVLFQKNPKNSQYHKFEMRIVPVFIFWVLDILEISTT